MTKAKIYSVNLSAFIYMVLHRTPELGRDHLNQIYFLFPDDSLTTLAINTYRNNRVSVDLRDYLTAYRTIRNMMRAFK